MDMIPIFLSCAENKYLALVIPDNQLLNRSLRPILSIALPPVGLYKAIRESHRFGFASLPRLFEIQVSSP